MLKDDVRQEVKRKCIHGGLTGTIAPLLIILIKDQTFVRILGLTLYAVFLVLLLLQEYSLKEDKNWNVPFASRAYKIMANDYEKTNRTFLGGIFIILSGILLVSFFDLFAALVGIMVLSYADSAAAIFGKAYPYNPILYNKKKHVEGSIAFGAVAFIVTIMSLHFSPITFPKAMLPAFIISGVTAFVESLPIKYYYDNLTVPIAAGLLAQLFLKAIY